MVMHLANRFYMKPVINRCEEIIAHKVDTLDMNRLFEVTRMPGDVVADVYAAKMKRCKTKRKKCCFL
ncbi:unnamed protein product [Enterobius vermicularis]|uniref:BTB domain-containing protein n=1 Tax=Enterobius vermicularis TaxID=51028 RepID=A0A0N4V7P4_ENTVE|nr:unnamed protein product [Enterobius vermicularis]